MFFVRLLSIVIFVAGAAAPALAAEQISFTNRSQRPADDCYRRLTLNLENDTPVTASFGLFGRCGGESPRSPVSLASDDLVELADGTVARTGVSASGPALVVFDFSNTRFPAAATPRVIPRFVVTHFEDGNLPENPFQIPSTPAHGNPVVYDSEDVRTIPPTPGATFEETTSYTWSIDSDVPSPDLARIAAEAAAQKCGGPAELVSSRAHQRPTHVGGVVTYTGTFRCAGDRSAQ
jgi:hypothetical protein